jgi:tripartite-type tricarboxylate transporter receptor subunit TctC
MTASALRAFASLVGCLCMMTAPSAAPQAYPTRPIEIIIPFAPGGSIDITFRAIAPSLSKRLGQQVVIINKPGGGATIGMNQVAKAAPDGYTLGAASFSFAANPSLVENLPYDPLKDFEPVTMVARSPMLLLVNPDSPAHTVQEFIDWVKARPGELNFTSVGVGSSGHLMAELFLSRVGLQMVHVPFTQNGFAPLAQGLVQLLIGPIPSSMTWIKDGRLRALAVTSLGPDPSVPGVPPLSDTVPGLEMFEWPSLVAPAGTPRAIVDRIQHEVAETIAEPDIKKVLATLGSQPVASSPEELQSFIVQQMAIWADVTRHLSSTREEK